MLDKLKPYWEYFKYILKHKYYVFIECFKRGLYFHAFVHDLSKFRPSEFINYTRYFYINKERYKDDFKLGWLHHQHRNKHHWEYWVKGNGEVVYMPIKYVQQMVCDLEAMGRNFGNTAKDYYLKNKDDIKLHWASRLYLESELDIQ